MTRSEIELMLGYLQAIAQSLQLLGRQLDIAQNQQMAIAQSLQALRQQLCKKHSETSTACGWCGYSENEVWGWCGYFEKKE